MTPRVAEEVRRHYGCPSLSGAELEDQGEEGTALTHWEKRLFEVRGKRRRRFYNALLLMSAVGQHIHKQQQGFWEFQEAIWEKKFLRFKNAETSGFLVKERFLG